MTDLNFHAIGDDNESISELTRIVKEFQEASNVNVNVSRLPWDRAWKTLLSFAIEGKGGDVAQVGSTWTPTLAALDSLRPFTQAEADAMGGAQSFVPAAWETVRVEGRKEVWAIPWSVYTFVVFYRRDLLLKAGVDETVAFSTPEAMRETLAALHKAGIAPWAISTKPRYLDLPHIASSWVRAYGGDFVSPDGKRAVFNLPSARRGLVEFLKLYRFMPASLRGLDYDACLAEFFQKGNTAVLIAGAESYSDALNTNTLSEKVRGVVGVAPVPGVSWIGGDHLVVWKTVRTDSRKERGAAELINWMMTVKNQARLQRENTILPARLDAYPELEFQPKEMKSVLETILQNARPHPPLRLWRRVESMLTDMLYELGRNVLNYPNQAVAEIIEARLEDEEKRFSLILGG